MGWFSRESAEAKAERLLHEAIAKRDNLSEVMFLIRDAPGAVRSQLNKEGRTALHRAAVAGRVDVAKALLPFQPDIDARDKVGQTPLHAAVDWTRVGMVEWLLHQGADPNAQDGHGGTPVLRLVMVSRRIVLMDLEHSGRQVTEQQRKEVLELWFGYAKTILQLLAANGADLNAGRPFSPLRFVLSQGDQALAQLLRSCGATG